MGFERNFFKRVLAAIPGTERHEKAQPVKNLYVQHHYEKYKESEQQIEKMFLPLKGKHNGILDANKKRIFAHIAELDSEGIHQLDLRQCLPEFERFWTEEVLKAKDRGFHLAGCGAVWFAQQTKTWPQEEYHYKDGTVKWQPGAPGLEKALWGASE